MLYRRTQLLNLLLVLSSDFFTQNVYVMELVIALLMWMGVIVSPDAGADLVQDDHHYIIEEYQAAAPSSAIVPDPDEL